TTLMGAWWWTTAALVGWSGMELIGVCGGPGAEATRWAPLQLAAVALSFCPVIALIGAKRPQHKAWNLVVFSLWAIVALPAAEAVLAHHSTRIELGAARSWFLWVLIGLTPINLLPTRFWLASLLIAASQIVVLGPHLALIRRALTSESELIGLLLATAALAS